MFFDFDGVVLESGDIKTEAFLELYEGQGIEAEVKEHHLSNQGVSRFGKFKWIAENLLNQTYTDQMGQELGNRFSALVKQKVIAAPFVKGFPEMMGSIAQSDIYCVVASGTPDTELQSIVKERNIGAWFHEVHGSPATKAQIVEDVLSRKGFERADCLFFGDASTDHEAAQVTSIDFCARLTQELSEYWNSVDYKYGLPDFILQP
jgi:phosphoglycolate phosphatase-like HAD superfamily hydrolase